MSVSDGEIMQRPIRVLFLTDSLGYPRVDGFGTAASEVWTYKLRDMLHAEGSEVSFFFDMKPFRDTRSLQRDLQMHCLSYTPDLIVLQVGIVDCYPRALKKTEFQIVSRIPILNRLVKRFVKRYYSTIVKMRNIAYVPLNEFKKNLFSLKSSFNDCEWIVLPIAPANKQYREKNPLISSRVESYNNVLKETFAEKFESDLYRDCDLENTFLSDNHHLSKYGHGHIAAQLSHRIREFEKSCVLDE